ncbi:MAG: hypothetical protein IJV39_03185 [Ruminococcus sp.]|nr:hypothetical protein [Ruminococcus sp.]
MDDLNSKINEIMSDPEKLKEIQNLGKMMGLTDTDSTADNTGNKGMSGNFNSGNSGMPDLSSLLNMSGTSGNQGMNSPPPTNPMSQLGGLDPGLISRFAPLLMSLNKEDETTRLFDALMPFLSDERKEKLQKIRKMMIIMKLLPNLRGLGLF